MEKGIFDRTVKLYVLTFTSHTFEQRKDSDILTKINIYNHTAHPSYERSFLAVKVFETITLNLHSIDYITSTAWCFCSVVRAKTSAVINSIIIVENEQSKRQLLVQHEQVGGHSLVRRFASPNIGLGLGLGLG